MSARTGIAMTTNATTQTRASTQVPSAAKNACSSRSAWVGFAVTLSWTVLFLAAAALVVRRRDA